MRNLLLVCLAVAFAACPASVWAQATCGAPANQAIAPSDLCDGSVDLGTNPIIEIESSTIGLLDDYDSGFCTPYASPGADGAYRVTVNDGCRIVVIYDECPEAPVDVFDRSLYLVGDCNNASGTCLCGSDQTSPAIVVFGPEQCAWTNMTGGTVTGFIVCDAFNPQEAGSYVLSVQTGCPVSVEEDSWGSVKGQYR